MVHKIVRFAAVLLLACAAALTVRKVHSSEAWQSTLTFLIGLPWTSIESARVAGLVFEAFLDVSLGGAFSTALAFSARLTAVASAALLSVAVFFGAYPGWVIGMFDPDQSSFLTGHMKLTAAFFLGGWMIAALSLTLKQKMRRPGMKSLT